MDAHRFFRYELRTTDVDAARAFYAAVFGAQFWDAGVSVSLLPERAVARGASPHWFGHLGVADVEATVGGIVALGGQQLGPTLPGPDGTPRAVLRDPFGAILGIGPEAIAPASTPVAWHVLHTEDRGPATVFYAALFGWTATEIVDLGPPIGEHQRFAWDESRRSVGSITSFARLPDVHAQWLFCFRVADIEVALDKVRAGGGEAIETVRSAGDARVVACHDPQRGSFALYQALQVST